MECPTSAGALAKQAALVRLSIFGAGISCETARSGSVKPIHTLEGLPFTFSLPPGDYTFVVTAFLDAQGTKPFAQGCRHPQPVERSPSGWCLDLLLAADMSVADGADGGGCAPLCTSSEICCGSSCCTTLHGTPTCPAGMCLYSSCEPGWGDCKAGNDGCETNLADSANCGQCGRKCKTCTSQTCTGDNTIEFGLPSHWSTSANPATLVVAELDQDPFPPNPDVAIAHNEGVSFFSGTGGATLLFRNTVSFPPGESGGAIVAGKFDTDDKIDIAVRGNTHVFLYQNASTNGTLSMVNSASPGLPAATYATLAAGDFDANGALDLVTTVTPNQLLILPGKGDGTFDSALPPIGVSGEVSAITVARVNDDAWDDLLVALPAEKVVGILFGLGGGGFTPLLKVGLTFSPSALVAVDLDYDGKIDLAVLGTMGHVAAVLNKGNGTYSVNIYPPSGVGVASGLQVADLSRDGNWDLLWVQGGEVSVLFGGPGGTFGSLQHIGGAGLNPLAVAVGNLDPPDERVDVVVTSTTNKVYTLQNTSH